MKMTKFACPHCQQSLEAPVDMCGETIDCPACQKPVSIPRFKAQRAERQPAANERPTLLLVVAGVFGIALIAALVWVGFALREPTDPVSLEIKAAKRGDAESQYRVGLRYYNGDGVAKNEEEALRWYLRAAERAHATAQCYVGYMYAKGRGTATNLKEAARWFELSSQNGSAQAQFNLAVQYEDGSGVKEDRAEALKWYREAAAQGHADAAEAVDRLVAKARPSESRQASMSDEEIQASLMELLLYQQQQARAAPQTPMIVCPDCAGRGCGACGLRGYRSPGALGDESFSPMGTPKR